MRLRPRWLLILLLLLPPTVSAQKLEPSTSAAAASRDVLVIDELICRGNVATSCDFILGHIYLSPGNTVDENELSNARLRLATLPSFESISIYLERGTARGHVRVIVEVVEADPQVREWLAGTSLRFDTVNQLLAGRLTHQNLFGTGKLLDAMLYAYVPIDGGRTEYGGRAQYVDPHWLDNKRMYFIAGLSGAHVASESISDFQWQATSFSADVAVGRRIFDFSFLSLGYRYSALANLEVRSRPRSSNVPRLVGPDDSHVVSTTYGWNSEDDPYFPTSGSRAAVIRSWISSRNDVVTDGGIRKTWTTDNGTSWVLQAEDTPATEYRGTFVNEHFQYFGGFARPISAGAEIQRGRWYVEAGYTPRGYNQSRERQREYGLKVGVRLKTRTFGFVDLYVIGSAVDTGRGPW
jgi:hypothetical protein